MAGKGYGKVPTGVIPEHPVPPVGGSKPQIRLLSATEPPTIRGLPPEPREGPDYPAGMNITESFRTLVDLDPHEMHEACMNVAEYQGTWAPDEEQCDVCTKPVLVQIRKGTGICSGRCHDALNESI